MLRGDTATIRLDRALLHSHSNVSAVCLTVGPAFPLEQRDSLGSEHAAASGHGDALRLFDEADEESVSASSASVSECASVIEWSCGSRLRFDSIRNKGAKQKGARKENTKNKHTNKSAAN